MKTKNTDVFMQNKIFLWVALATGLILSIPLVAMQFIHEVNWSLSDFVVMGAFLFVTGSLYIMAARMSPKHRILIGIVFALVFLWIWAELAVGIFTTWGS